MKSLLSQRVSQLKPSATLAISAKAKEMKGQGIDVVGFGAGEPDFPTPMHIREAAKQSLDRGETFYTPVGGIPALKKAIIDRFDIDYGLIYKPEEILVSCGAKHSLFNLFLALLNKGDEVLIFAPYWLSYPEMVELAEGTPVIVGAKEESRFVPDIDEVASKITAKTKVIVLNSPSNPTGVLYPQEFMTKLAELVEKHDLLVISDDIYDKLLYEGLKFTPFAALPGMKDKTVVVNGVSKTYAMTGFRIGYLASVNTALVKAATNIQGQSTSNPTATAQAASLEALSGPQDEIARMRDIFEKRRDLMMSEAAKIEGLTTVKPDGAFYLFVNTSKFYGAKNVTDSTSMAAFLLESQQVACVPGGPFGSEDYVRLSFAVEDDTIKKGMERIAEACRELS